MVKYTDAWFMRDIMKRHSGTHSGTGVSLSKMLYFDDILMRGRISKPKKSNYELIEKLIVSFSYL